MRLANYPLFAAVAALAAVGLLGLAEPGAAQAESDRCDIDMGLTLDRSGSMGQGPNMVSTQTGSLVALDRLESRDLSGLVSFSDSASLDKSLDNDHEATKQAVLGLVPVGGTDIAAGIALSHSDFTNQGRLGARQVMVLLADGGSASAAAGAANAAKNDGIAMFVIQVGLVEDPAMRALASTPTSDFYRLATTPDQVVDAFEDMIESTLNCVPPVPDFTWTPDCAGRATSFQPAVNSSFGVAQHEWDFGDGSTQTQNPPNSTTRHTYASPGTYNVTLRVRDTIGQVGGVNHTVTVDDCPVADFECSATSTPLEVRFRDLSTDADNDIVRHTWRLGDGTTTSGTAFTHAYPTRTTWKVHLEVEDDDGHISRAERNCTPLNQPPVLEPVPVQVVYEGQVVSFRLRAHDPDDDPLRFSMQDTVPSTPQFDFLQGTFQWHTWSGSAGTYNGTLFRVTDGELWDSTTVQIIVLEGPRVQYEVGADGDRDGFADGSDNCPGTTNRDQADSDGDGIGDACEPAGAAGSAGGPDPAGKAESDPVRDTDRDGVADTRDNCIRVPNADQADLDQDGVGDACDPDVDGDGVAEPDNCPRVANPDQRDMDKDGFGDACDPDVDGDGIRDALDDCPLTWSPEPSDARGGGGSDGCPADTRGVPNPEGDGRSDGRDAQLLVDGQASRGGPWLWVGSSALALLLVAALVAGVLLLHRRRRE